MADLRSRKGWSGCTGVGGDGCAGWRRSRSAWSSPGRPWPVSGSTAGRRDRRRARADDLHEHRPLRGRRPVTTRAAPSRSNALAKIGNTLYVGGQFTQIAPSGCRTRPCRSAQASPGPTSSPPTPPPAADLELRAPWSTGRSTPSRSIRPRTRSTWAAGSRTVNGQALSNFAILDATTGALKAGSPSCPSPAVGSHTSGRSYRHPLTNKLYIGGDFTNIGGPRNRGERLASSLPGNTRRQLEAAGQRHDPARSGSTRPTRPRRRSLRRRRVHRPPPGNTSFVVHRRVRQHRPVTSRACSPLRHHLGPERSPAIRRPAPGARLAVVGGNVYLGMGGFGGRFYVFSETDSTNPIVAWILDGDVQTVYPIGNEVLVGGHFTRIYNRPDPANPTYPSPCAARCSPCPPPTRRTSSPRRTCSTRATTARSPWSPRTTTATAPPTTPTGAASSGASPRAAIPRTQPFNPDIGQGQCGTGLQGPWGGLWHLQETPGRRRPQADARPARSASRARPRRPTSPGRRPTTPTASPPTTST